MKYGASWKSDIASLPKDLAEYSISYKKWKKHSHLTCTSLDALTRECDRVNRLFVHLGTLALKSASSASVVFAACSCASVAPHPLDLYKFATLNKNTVYKVCKRMTKRKVEPHAMQWLAQLQKEHKYEFMGSFVLTRLALEAQSESVMPTLSCPICLEEPQDNPDLTMYLLDCGHAMCITCLVSWMEARKTKGVLSNVLAYQSYRHHKSCPICRYSRPLSSISEEHIWPKSKSNALRAFQDSS
jgi:hypothetical protein